MSTAQKTPGRRLHDMWVNAGAEKFLPKLPELNFLGDDVSYGYDASDMREYALEAVNAVLATQADAPEAGQEAAAVQAVGAEPLFWYRPCGDNLYEGPFHTNSTEGKQLREEKPDAWHPLYSHTPPTASVVTSDEQIITAASHRGMWGLRDDAGNITTDGRRLISVVRSLAALSGSLGDGEGRTP